MGKKILAIDDDSAILEAIKIILEDEGYEVTTADNPETLQSIEQIKPDLIILDILLSGVDGRQICKSIKLNSKTSSIPIILISAHLEAKKSILSCGADAFISKPFDMHALYKMIDKLVK